MKFLYTDLPAFQFAGKTLVGRVVLGLLILGAALSGTLVGLLIVYSTDLPQISELERYRPSTITELYDAKGRVIGSFALQRRILAQYDDIPKVLRDAIISTEDKNFERHWGINFWRVMGATYRDLSSNTRAQGASTLTMQLSRNLFLSPERHFSRKIQEAMLAILPRAPVSYSPLNNPERALKRRNLVINNLLEDGKITTEEAARAKSTPLRLRIEPDTSPAPYFVEEVRRHLEKKFGSDQVHEGGLRVYTSLDLDLQKAATRSVMDGLAAYEHRHGWKGHLHNVIEAGDKLEKFQSSDWLQPIAVGGYIHGVVVDLGLQFAKVRFARYSASIGPAELAWTHRKLPRNLLKVGDVVYLKVLALNPDGSARVSLEQDSGLQGALLAIDNATGDIKAMVGGRDFDESKYNRATQAQRQVGSSFKAFVYTAAIDQGAKPDDTILDAPVIFQTASGPYTPHNYDERYEGTITL